MAFASDKHKELFPALTLDVSKTVVGEAIPVPFGAFKQFTAEANFVRAGGGTSVDVYVQTSLDGGDSWIDIMNFRFLTTTAKKVSAVRRDVALAAATVPGDAALGSNLIVDGLMGDRVRAKVVVVGTYTGASTIRVTGCF